jgi:glutamyl-tRNA reductase
MDELRQNELNHLFNRVELDKRERDLVKKMSQRLVNKILHQPTTRLKREAAGGNGYGYTAAMRYLFALDKADFKE